MRRSPATQPQRQVRSAKRSCKQDNQECEFISIRQLVTDPQFKSGLRDRLRGLPPKPFFYDPAVGGYEDGYERGRLTGVWILATGQRPPAMTDVDRLAQLFLAAADADVVL
jgi:hypothetical protein